MSHRAHKEKKLDNRARKVLSGHAGEDAHHGFISRARSSGRFVEERSPTFNWGQFSATLVYHLSWPLCLPLVAWAEGPNALYAFSFVPVDPSVYPDIFTMLCSVVGMVMFYILYFMASEAARLTMVPEMLVRMHVAYYVARQVVIAIKYAYTPPKQYRLMMRAEYKTSWAYNQKIMLVYAWLSPDEQIIRRELALASSRLQLDASRYEVTVDKRLRSYLHSALSVGLKTRAPGAAFLGGRGGAAAVVPTAPVRQGSFHSNPHMRAWEKRCACGKVTIEDLATVVLVAGSKEGMLSMSTIIKMNFAVTFVLLLSPYALLAVEGRIASVDTSVPHIIANVLFTIGGVQNLGSLLLFMATAVRDYLMRAKVQGVLTQLTRPIASSLVESGVNVLLPNAAARFNSTVSATSTQEEITHDLDSIVDLNLREDDATPPAAVESETHVQVAVGAGAPPPLDDSVQAGGSNVVQARGSSPSLTIGLPPAASEGKEEVPPEDATAADDLLQDLGGADGKNDSSYPPIIDVTRPSNAFAWIKLKELLGEIGSNFQLRMQMYLGVITALILILLIFTLVRTLGEGKAYGDDATTELLIFASITHVAFMFLVLWTSILLGAFANAETDQQAEALTHARVELQEVARELLVAMEHKAAHAAYAPTPGLGGMLGTLAEADGRGTPSGRQSPASVGSLVGDDRDQPGGGRSLHNVGSAVSSMALSHVSALLTGITAAGSALGSTIEALQVHRDAHPVRVVGFPATYSAARVMLTLVFTLVATLSGRGLTNATG